MWKPISSLNVAGHDGILTERGNLSVLQMLLDKGAILTERGNLSVVQMLLDKMQF